MAPSPRDERAEVEIVSTETKLHGWVWNITSDTFRLGDGELTREYLDHTSAVAVLALDDDDRLALIRQYRHPVRHRDWELPAGLLDAPAESPLETAKRELAEEADLAAREWHLLLDFFTSPGGSSESIRIFLARGLAPTPERYARTAEEAEIVVEWLSLDDAVDAILAGDLHNPAVLHAVLAASESRRRGWTTLRDPGTPWPTRSRFPSPTPRALVDGGRA